MTDAPLRLAVFDMDGTLIDSQRSIARVLADTCKEHGHQPPPPGVSRRVIGLSLDAAFARLFPALPDGEHAALSETYRTRFHALRVAGQVEEPFFDGAQKAIHDFTNDGWLLGIATGKAYRGVVNSLSPHDLLIPFVTVQTADRAPGKPHPGMLLQAMDETGADPRNTVMIGDTTYDMEMARNAGTHAIGVNWGYHEGDELLAAGASTVIHSFDQLRDAAAQLMETQA